MKETSRKKRSGRSFSEISHNSTRRMDGPSDGKDDVESDAAMEELVANVINREIYEWQYVCETGRPYWWSPEQKYHRLRKHFPRKSTDHNPRTWMSSREVDDCPKPTYDARRRTVSEGYLSDSVNAHTLAHTIAIQLLSSCFTLPPYHVSSVPPPNYPTFDKVGGPTVPDPRMIRSLRMHTNFRYSPSFGHQACNTSPVPLWPVLFDGQSRNTSLPGSSGGSGSQTPDIGTSGFKGKRNRRHRRLHVTERSTLGFSVESDAGEHVRLSSGILDPTVTSTAWHRRRSTNEQTLRSLTVPNLPRHARNTKHRHRGTGSLDQPPTPNSSAADDNKNSAEANRGADFRQQPSTNYRMQSVIRSEPHHVFVQPVRELVVKRWRTLRRRFAGSLHSPLPCGTSEDSLSASESGLSGVSSPVMSNDGKSRRQRAQERGNIHSSSVDSTAHYNSPVTRCATPDDNGGNRPYRVDSAKASPTFQLADPLSTAAALAVAEAVAVNKRPSRPGLDASAQSSSSIQASTSPLPSSTASTSGNTYAKPPTGSFTGPQSTSSSTRSFSRRGSFRRKSMLSEAHTPDDYLRASVNVEVDRDPVDRSILSVPGSAPASPKEDTRPSLPTLLRHWSQEIVSSLGPMSHLKVKDPMETRNQEGPRLRRTSTSGTQVFHPDADGVEIDGLSVGPGRETWARKGRRERTYL
jgi:hypothetical protein